MRRRLAPHAPLVVVMLLAIVAAQWRLVTIERWCCCPSPTQCHCPHDNQPAGGQPSMRVCHETQDAVVTPTAPAFEPVSAVAVVAPPRIVRLAPFVLTTPHAPPPIRRLDAPS